MIMFAIIFVDIYVFNAHCTLTPVKLLKDMQGHTECKTNPEVSRTLFQTLYQKLTCAKVSLMNEVKGLLLLVPISSRGTTAR